MKSSFSQIKISYSNKIKPSERVAVTTSQDAANYMREVWEDIEYRESIYLLCLNRKNDILGYGLISIGGITGSTADLKVIFQTALLSNATGILLLHNHPSNNEKPSEADKELTQKIKEAAKIMDITFYDHIIMLPEGYVSFADEGLL